MILCHKCAGILTRPLEGEDQTGLSGCCCISGWVRDGQVHVDRVTAIRQQLQQAKDRQTLYARQGRPDEDREYLTAKIDRLTRQL